MGLEGIHPQPLKFIVGFAQYDRPTLPWLTQHADTERLLRRYCNFTTPVRYCHCQETRGDRGPRSGCRGD